MFNYQFDFLLLLTIKATAKDVNVHIDLKDLEDNKISDDKNLVFHMDEEGGANEGNGTEGAESGADYAKEPQVPLFVSRQGNNLPAPNIPPFAVDPPVSWYATCLAWFSCPLALYSPSAPFALPAPTARGGDSGGY